jgi:phosphoribosyl 1,2-cyclic phosphodiesterase
MPLHFKSLCSSSSGNCLVVWTDKTRILIDCGLGSMKRTRQALKTHLGIPANLDAVIISHNHSDHISYYPLRVLEELGTAIRIHENNVEQLKNKHFNGYGFDQLKLKPFGDAPFTVGDLSIRPFEVPHNPDYFTYGFVITYLNKKIVIATDFNSWRDSIGHFADSDFIFVESNHDLELLRLYFNPNSRFHMPNPQTSQMICEIRKKSRKAPHTVMLGHLSSQRNEPHIAMEETRKAFKEAGIKLDFELSAAPRLETSAEVKIS